MAPSGAGLSLAGSLLIWLLAALGWVGPGPSVATGSQCDSIDDAFSEAIRWGPAQPNVSLGPGCHMLFHNFVCTPINSSLVLMGSEDATSTWDTKFDLYQFSIESGRADVSIAKRLPAATIAIC
jgi:hypothetical protein